MTMTRDGNLPVEDDAMGSPAGEANFDMAGSKVGAANAEARHDAGGGDPRRPRKGRRKLKIALLAVLVAVVAGGAILAIAVHRRIEEERAGTIAMSAPSTPHELEGSTGRAGAFTAHVDFTSLAATEGQHVSTEISWDDAWFFQDPTVYNHDLATTCSVLSAVANAESSYYQAGSDAPAYLENAFAQLGFDDISTASYQYRSEIFDEVVDFITGTDDVVAYSIASKRIAGPDGSEKTLYVVSVRGSYGAEWLSDFNMGDAADYQMDAIDHQGFMEAANEIVEQLADRITEDAQDRGTDDVALLFCGHSRGAATANLAASYADDMTEGLRPLAPLGSIYCYTFATPEVTEFTNVTDPIYDNIFNIMNPSDMVPRMPLASWGYSRYGNDLWLPGYGDDGFDEMYEEMVVAFEENVGAPCPYVPEDRENVDRLIDDLSREVPTEDDLVSVGTFATLVHDLTSGVDLMQILYGHYPGVYIAWMQTIDGGDLRQTQ